LCQQRHAVIFRVLILFCCLWRLFWLFEALVEILGL
jgi:hypothetical protein